jgi:hypothetical protein
MGWSSVDDYVAEATGGKFYRADVFKQWASLGTVVAGRWYDYIYCDGNPMVQFQPGNYAMNGHFYGGSSGWTLGSANWAWTAATHLLTRTANADVSTVSQNTPCTNGVSYSVVYTLTRSAGGITVSLGGTNGTQRTSAGTFRESITCGATANAPLVFTPDATFAGTIDVVAVTRDLAFTPLSDVANAVGSDHAVYHGGNVSSDTKHLVNAGFWVNAAVHAPCVIQIVDMLGVYPRIMTNSSSVQTLNNDATLPRYANGKGVRAYYSLGATTGANANNFTFTYTNQSDASGRAPGATIANTASAIIAHMHHSGVAANNFGPFLPMAAGDQGIKSVQSVQLSAATASAGEMSLFLCRPIATIPVTTAFVAAERDFMNQLPSLPRIYDGACLGFLVFAGGVIVAGNGLQGYLDFAWG